MKKPFALLAFLLFCLTPGAMAQEETRSIDIDFQVKNMHYWRGYAVSTSPLMASSLYYQSPNGQWKFGFWGAMGFEGVYREFNSFISWRNGNFWMALWDIYNFSSPDISGKGFFDYSARTTGHFLDLTLGYSFAEKFPLSISASTIILGRDSEFIGAEPNTFFERTGNLRYTTYVEGRYTVLDKPNYQLQVFAGGAFALAGANDTFYTNRNGINFVGLTYRTDIKLGNYTLPVQATPAWNPAAEHAYMEVALNIF